MKHLVLTLAMFLLMGSQTLAQDIPTMYQSQKPVLCGFKKVIYATIEEFGEQPIAAWIEPIVLTTKVFKSSTMVWINKETGTATVTQELPNEVACMISQGEGAAAFPSFEPKSDKTSVKYLTN